MMWNTEAKEEYKKRAAFNKSKGKKVTRHEPRPSHECCLPNRQSEKKCVFLRSSLHECRCCRLGQNLATSFASQTRTSSKNSSKSRSPFNLSLTGTPPKASNVNNEGNLNVAKYEDRSIRRHSATRVDVHVPTPHIPDRGWSGLRLAGQAHQPSSAKPTHLFPARLPQRSIAAARNFPSLSFSGCGLHVFFQIGVAHCFLEHGVRCEQICATSAGVASALYYLLDMRPYINLKKLLRLIPPMKYKCPRGRTNLEVARSRMIKYIGLIITSYFPQAYETVSGKLEIVLTSFPTFEMKTFNRWTSNKDLLGCLAASTDIPFVDSKAAPTCWRGKNYYDGGIICSHPIIDQRTICVTTSSFSQPWTRAWRTKRQWYGEISHPLTCGSLDIMELSFYKELWHIGCEKAHRFLGKTKKQKAPASKKKLTRED